MKSWFGHKELQINKLNSPDCFYLIQWTAVCWHHRLVQYRISEVKFHRSDSYSNVCKADRFVVLLHSSATFLTTLSLSGAWSNRVSNASRSVESKPNRLVTGKMKNEKKKMGQENVKIPQNRSRKNEQEHTVSARESPLKRRETWEMRVRERRRNSEAVSPHWQFHTRLFTENKRK